MPCTKSWINASGGSFEDGANWSGGYQPNSGDVACIDLPGTYAVTITYGRARHLYVGGNGAAPSVFLEADSTKPWATTQLDVSTLLVKSGSSLVMYPDARMEARELEIQTSALVQVAGQNVIKHIHMEGGLLSTGGPTTVDSVEMFDINDGTVVIGRTYPLSLNVVDSWGVDFSGGVVTGDDKLFVNFRGGSPGDVDWIEATLSPMLSDPDEPIVSLRGMSLHIYQWDTYGMIDVDPDGEPIEVGGVINPNVRLRVRRAQWSPVAPVDLDRLTNRGEVEFTTSLSEALRVTGALINEGTVRIGSGRADFELDSLHNAGTIVVKDSVRLTKGILRNAGTIQVTSSAGDLVIARNGDFLTEPTGSVQGTLYLESGGRVGGDGTLNRVISNGGTVNPGGPGDRVGSLTINTLLLDDTSRVIINVGGTTSAEYDRVHVPTYLRLAGTLDIKSVPPFTAGVCGQVVRPITHGRTGIRTGAFTATAGAQVAPGRRWRVYTAATSVELIGFDPSFALSVAPTSIAGSEGAAGVPVDLCLAGSTAPSGTVTVNSSSPLGQSSASPDPVTFTSTNWMYPQRLTVSAIDDAIAEGTVVDSIRLRLTSSDPAFNGVARTKIAHIIADNDAGADLSIAHAGGPTVVNLNQNFEGLFRVTNAGPAASTASTVVITPMAGMTYVSSAPTVSCVDGGTSVTCTVGPVAAGSTTDFTILFRASASGTHDNTATITGAEYDPVAGNNSGTWTVTVN